MRLSTRLLPLAFTLAFLAPAGASADAGPDDAAIVVDAAVPSDAAIDAAPIDAGSAAVDETVLPQPTQDAEGVAKAFYQAVTTKNWFLLAGAALAAVLLGLKPLLEKKWPSFKKDRWGVALAAGCAGLVALSGAWMADAPVATALTLVGAVKIFVAAVATYITGKKTLFPAT